jgi:hypothetical protein
MSAMLVIFFVEFGSSRYLAQVDEKVMQMQLRDSGSQTSIIESVTPFLSRRKVVINGRRVSIDVAVAGEAADRAAEAVLTHEHHGHHGPVDEETPLLESEEGPGKPRGERRDSHCGHHHYDPAPLDGHRAGNGTMSDHTRRSQLLGVAILEGGLCFHSIFVGLTLAVATGGGFISLLIAIMFHRTPTPTKLT